MSDEENEFLKFYRRNRHTDPKSMVAVSKIRYLTKTLKEKSLVSYENYFDKKNLTDLMMFSAELTSVLAIFVQRVHPELLKDIMCVFEVGIEESKDHQDGEGNPPPTT